MTSYGEPRVWLEEFPLGQAVPFYRDHLGLRYQGEVIRAARWLPAWGEPLGQDAFFRIVLLQQRGRQQDPKIQDSRIALCFPATGLSRHRSRYSNEMATIRETLGAYRIQRDTEGELIRSGAWKKRKNNCGAKSRSGSPKKTSSPTRPKNRTPPPYSPVSLLNPGFPG